MIADTHTTTEQTAEKLREVARYLDAHAESLVGDMDSVFVLDGGLRFSFVLSSNTVPTVEVARECIVWDEP